MKAPSVDSAPVADGRWSLMPRRLASLLVVAALSAASGAAATATLRASVEGSIALLVWRRRQ